MAMVLSCKNKLASKLWIRYLYMLHLNNFRTLYLTEITPQKRSENLNSLHIYSIPVLERLVTNQSDMQANLSCTAHFVKAVLAIPKVPIVKVLQV